MSTDNANRHDCTRCHEPIISSILWVGADPFHPFCVSGFTYKDDKGRTVRLELSFSHSPTVAAWLDGLDTPPEPDLLTGVE